MSPVHSTAREFENGGFTLKAHEIFSSTLRRRNFKTQQSPVVLDLCLRKTPAGKSRDYRDVIVFEKLRFQSVFRPHENKKPALSNSSGFKSGFSKISVFVTD